VAASRLRNGHRHLGPIAIAFSALLGVACQVESARSDDDMGLSGAPTFRILVVNDAGVEARVWADAGAGRVLLDTVAAGDSGRVNLDMDAASVWLEALDRAGEVIHDGRVELHPDSLNRWTIPAGEI